VVEETEGAASTSNVKGVDEEEAPYASTAETVSTSEVKLVGGTVTTKFSCVALTFWKTPSFSELVPVVVGPKPVPVRTTIVPTGAPSARATGAAVVMVGPATLKAAGNVVPAMSAA
jgi:hypothetical protein